MTLGMGSVQVRTAALRLLGLATYLPTCEGEQY